MTAWPRPFVILGGGASSPGGGAVFVPVPALPTSPGTAGQLAYDDSYIYVCVAANTWTRAPISEWTP